MKVKYKVIVFYNWHTIKQEYQLIDYIFYVINVNLSVEIQVNVFVIHRFSKRDMQIGNLIIRIFLLT